MFQMLFLLLIGFSTSIVFGQVPFPPLPQPVTAFSFEDKNWNIEATTTPKSGLLHAPTPTSIPGARVIKTLELKALLDANRNVVVVDVLDSKTRKSIPGAFWLPGAGDGQFYAAEKSRFTTALEKLTGGDKTRPLVFLCISSECWLSYNASLRALEAGYKDVIWYRGGTNSWTGASFELTKPESVQADALLLNDIKAQNGIQLSVDELRQLMPGAKVTNRTAAGSTRYWTNELDGKFVASSDNGATTRRPSTAQGTWHVGDHGTYCVTLEWRTASENWCRYIFKVGEKYYGVSSVVNGTTKAHEFEFAK